MTHAANNPFFGKFKTPFETPPFDKIKIEHYEPASTKESSKWKRGARDRQ